MNNKGWGLQTMLILSSVLIIALFVSVLIVITNVRILMPNNNEEFLSQYKLYESKLEEFAKEYVADTNPDTRKDINVTYKTLLDNKYVEKLIDPYNNLECNGYVIVRNNEYKPYLKCGLNYRTSGYNFINE
jgi:hypothetical protein